MTAEDSHSNRKLVNMVSTTVYDAPAPKNEAAKDGESNAAGGSVPGLIMHMEESQMHDALPPYSNTVGAIRQHPTPPAYAAVPTEARS